MRFKTMTIVAAVLFAVTILTNSAKADVRTFGLILDGACAGSGESGSGSGTFTLDTDTGLVSYNITFQGLVGGETFAHVHGPAADCATANSAQIVWGLSTGSPKVGSYTITAPQQTEMMDGLHFVNIHTSTHSSGELRGQILVLPIPAVSQWGLLAMTLVMLSGGCIAIMRRRRVAVTA